LSLILGSMFSLSGDALLLISPTAHVPGRGEADPGEWGLCWAPLRQNWTTYDGERNHSLEEVDGSQRRSGVEVLILSFALSLHF
jgi:hypothetical protein